MHPAAGAAPLMAFAAGEATGDGGCNRRMGPGASLLALLPAALLAVASAMQPGLGACRDQRTQCSHSCPAPSVTACSPKHLAASAASSAPPRRRLFRSMLASVSRLQACLKTAHCSNCFAALNCTAMQSSSPGPLVLMPSASGRAPHGIV